MTSFLSDKKLVKSMIAGAVAVSIDKLYFKSTDLKNTLLMAAVIAGSSYVSSIISPKFDISTYENSVMDATVVQERAIELGLGVGGSFLINKYMFDNLKNDFNVKDGAILFLGSSFVSEYASDYIFKQPLSYLS